MQDTVQAYINSHNKTETYRFCWNRSNPSVLPVGTYIGSRNLQFDWKHKLFVTNQNYILFVHIFTECLSPPCLLARWSVAQSIHMDAGLNQGKHQGLHIKRKTYRPCQWSGQLCLGQRYTVRSLGGGFLRRDTRWEERCVCEYTASISCLDSTAASHPVYIQPAQCQNNTANYQNKNHILTSNITRHPPTAYYVPSLVPNWFWYRLHNNFQGPRYFQ